MSADYCSLSTAAAMLAELAALSATMRGRIPVQPIYMEIDEMFLP